MTVCLCFFSLLFSFFFLSPLLSQCVQCVYVWLFPRNNRLFWFASTALLFVLMSFLMFLVMCLHYIEAHQVICVKRLGLGIHIHYTAMGVWRSLFLHKRFFYNMFNPIVSYKHLFDIMMIFIQYFISLLHFITSLLPLDLSLSLFHSHKHTRSPLYLNFKRFFIHSSHFNIFLFDPAFTLICLYDLPLWRCFKHIS